MSHIRFSVFSLLTFKFYLNVGRFHCVYIVFCAFITCLLCSYRKFFKSSGNDGYPSSIESIERAAAAESRASPPKKKKEKNRPPTLRDIPKLTKDLLMQNSKSTTLKEAQENAIAAAKKLYELCDVGHKANREVMVASGQYDVIGPLTQCLLHEPIYEHGDENNTPSLPPNSTLVTLPHQQPKFGDDIDDIDEKKTDSAPITPDASTNGETNVESTENNSTTIEKSSETTATEKTETNSPKSNTTEKSDRKKQNKMDEKLHFVCLTLNNLSIPHDNKRVMVRERGAKRLIGNLCKVIASGKREAHLCCIILMNLSFYEPGLTIIGQFSPTPKYSSIESSPHSSPDKNASQSSGKAKKALQTTTTILKRAADVVTRQRKLTPLENPDSLLRIIQDLLSTAERGTSDFRWAFGLLANLSRHPENALLIGLTGIPKVAIANLRLSKIPSNEWATNSLEDFSLYFLLHLAEASSQGLEGALEVTVPIMKGDHSKANGEDSSNISKSNTHRGGIQSLKATMICALLGLEWKEFPDHGVIAAGNVSELMGNTFERVGKKRVYTDNDFALRTAVSAYAALAKAAAKADSNEAAACVHTKIMALPTSVALLFQIINAIALHWGEESRSMSNTSGHGESGTGGSESYADAYHWDIKAGELAVSAVMSLLPALLEGTGEATGSMLTQQACADLSKIFVFFSKKTNSISVRARSAEVAEKLTESASGGALPLLEASYDLCRNFGTHRLQKNFL